jgi:hypothetical protein
MAHAHWIWVTQATNTHSEYGRITAFPLQKWLHECTSMLRYTYTACLILTNLFDVIFSQCQRQKGAMGNFSLLVIGLSISGSFHHRPIAHIPFVYQWCNNLGIWQRHWIKHYPLSHIQPHIIHKSIPIKGFRPEFNNVCADKQPCVVRVQECVTQNEIWRTKLLA